jgi:hypothetical protein
MKESHRQWTVELPGEYMLFYYRVRVKNGQPDKCPIKDTSVEIADRINAPLDSMNEDSDAMPPPMVGAAGSATASSGSSRPHPKAPKSMTSQARPLEKKSGKQTHGNMRGGSSRGRRRGHQILSTRTNAQTVDRSSSKKPDDRGRQREQSEVRDNRRGSRDRNDRKRFREHSRDQTDRGNRRRREASRSASRSPRRHRRSTSGSRSRSRSRSLSRSRKQESRDHGSERRNRTKSYKDSSRDTRRKRSRSRSPNTNSGRRDKRSRD